MEELNYETNEKEMKYLELFKNKLESDGLSNSTIKEHVFNTRFYLNDYLTYYEYIPMEKVMSHICEVFSDWFIRKAMWSTPASIKSNISSLKKFYKLMVELNYASKEDYLEMLDDIKYENIVGFQPVKPIIQVKKIGVETFLKSAFC